MSIKGFLRGAAIFGLAAMPANAITNGYEPAPTNSRFDAIGAFAVTWRLGLAFGHPDDAPNAWFCTATLVSPRVVLLAAHCVTPYGPTAPYAVRFRRAEDGTLGTLEGGPSSYYHAFIESFIFPSDNTDFVYGILSTYVKHITPIPTSFTTPLPVSTPILQAGWGREGPGYAQGPATGLHICANTVFYSTPEGIWPGQPYGPDQGEFANSCGVNSWDSGGPILVRTKGRRGLLLLIGVTHGAGYAVRPSMAPPQVTSFQKEVSQ